MKLIADSGSSTTDWRLINGEQISTYQSMGLNPLIVSKSIIQETLLELKIPFKKVKTVYFYGAGCGNSEHTQHLREVLESIFIEAVVHIESDLLAAAHALLGHESGSIGILGTGSNVAYYDGQEVKPYSQSLGYLLGDEGSGNALGKQFLKQYLLNQFDPHLYQIIKIDKKTIISQLYQHPYPNRFLASFTKTIFRNRKQPQVAQLISNVFDQWIRQCILPYSITSIHLCGSIAYYFSTELKMACNQKGIQINDIIEKPIAALCLYHLNKQ